jgi:hypothetical protein
MTGAESVDEIKQRIAKITAPHVEKLLEILAKECGECEDEELVEFEEKRDQEIGEVLHQLEKALEQEGFEANIVTDTMSQGGCEEWLIKGIFTKTEEYEVYFVACMAEDDKYHLVVSSIDASPLVDDDTPFSQRLLEVCNFPVRDTWAGQIQKVLSEITEAERAGKLEERLPSIYESVKFSSWVYEFKWLQKAIEATAKEFNIQLE